MRHILTGFFGNGFILAVLFFVLIKLLGPALLWTLTTVFEALSSFGAGWR